MFASSFRAINRVIDQLQRALGCPFTLDVGVNLDPVSSHSEIQHGGPRCTMDGGAGHYPLTIGGGELSPKLFDQLVD